MTGGFMRIWLLCVFYVLCRFFKVVFFFCVMCLMQGLSIPVRHFWPRGRFGEKQLLHAGTLRGEQWLLFGCPRESGKHQMSRVNPHELTEAYLFSPPYSLLFILAFALSTSEGLGWIHICDTLFSVAVVKEKHSCWMLRLVVCLKSKLLDSVAKFVYRCMHV